jgi:hypothetical protein
MKATDRTREALALLEGRSLKEIASLLLQLGGAGDQPDEEFLQLLSARFPGLAVAELPDDPPVLRPNPRLDLQAECFELLVQEHDARASREGQVFTPPALATHLVKLLEPAAGQRWLDPAAGLGAFLHAAAAEGVRPQELHGLELDPLTASLLALCAPGMKISQGNALASLDELPAGWREGFDRVVLNPPYRNAIEARDPDWLAERERLKSQFQSCAGSFDLYIPFIERGLELLLPGGQLGLLVPDKWLSARYGDALRRLLPEKARLKHLQHSSARRLFPRVDFEMLLLVLEKRNTTGAFYVDGLKLEALDSELDPIHQLDPPPEEMLKTARGWGCLLASKGRRRFASPASSRLGEVHEVQASLSTSEFYTIQLHEESENRSGLPLLSSGAIDPFLSWWGKREQRVRGQRWLRPLVDEASLSHRRIEQAGRHRVLLANMSKRLEALPVQPGQALGVVNVMQVFCRDEAETLRLAAWLNAGPLDDWLASWFSPLRLSGQLSLSRDLVASLPLPPDDPKVLRHLEELASSLMVASIEARPALFAQLDECARPWLPLYD